VGAKMIFFDIDDTLLDNQAAESAAAKDFHYLYRSVFPLSPDEFAQNWRIITEKHVQRYLSGELSFQGQRRERLKEIFSHNRILSDAEADNLFQKYLGCYEKNWRLFPDVITCFDRLKDERLGIISNGDSVQQRQKLTATGIIERFSVILISGDIGVSKPDLKIFLEACRMAEVDPSECWHIGDNFEADFQGCMSVGMNGVWLAGNGADPIKDCKAIRSLSDLKNIMEKPYGIVNNATRAGKGCNRYS
jgi:putative hydrolase of the HAD superfamily